MPGELVTIASLNTRGIPLTGSQLAGRYAAIGAGFDAGDADVVCCQEVFTYWHLRLLVRRMRSFRRVSWRPGPFGPYGGLVTFSRRPVSGTAFRRFGRPPRAPGVPRASRVQARLKGALVTRLARPELCVINTHPVANHDGDWSEANRFYPLLTAGEVTAESAALVFAGKEPLGYVSDHIGLRARLSLTSTAVRATPRPGA